MTTTTRRAIEAPVPGELWEFPLGGSDLLGWVVIQVDPDEDNRFLVAPADTEEAVGPRDLAVPQAASDGATGRLVLRGDWTRWMAGRDFWFRAAVGAVPGSWRDLFLERMRGETGAAGDGCSVVREEALAWADHADWLRSNLATAREALERWEARESFREVVDCTGAPPGLASGEYAGALAADGASAMDALLAEPDDERDERDERDEGDEFVRELFHVFAPHESSGAAGASSRAYLHMGVSAAYFELDSELAPRDAFVLTGEGGRVFLRWNRTLSRRWRSQELPLSGGILRVVVEGEPVIDVEIDFES